MTKACFESKFLTSLESNTVYVANIAEKKYECPQSLCSQIGSFANPCTSIEEAFSVIEKKFAPETKITISFSPGIYKTVDSKSVPKNVITMISTLGNSVIEGNLSLVNHPTMKILKMDISGDIYMSANGQNETTFYLENSTWKGKYKLTVEDEANKTLVFDTVSQTIDKTTKTETFGNEIMVKDKGSVVLKALDCITESKLKGKVDLSGSGKLNREIKNGIVGTAGEETNYSKDSSFLERVTDLEIYSNF